MIIVWGIAILALAIFLFSSIAKGQNVLKTNIYSLNHSMKIMLNKFEEYKNSEN